MDRSFAERNAASRDRLAATVAGLDGGSLDREADGGWTVAALLAHLAFWDELVAARWSLARHAGSRTPIGLDEELTDLLNEAALPTWRSISANRVLELVTAAAARVDAVVAGLSDESVAEIAREGRPRLLDRSLHREEHLAAIQAALGR
jgi:uncharacterized damage-inducible protein DinB